MIHFFKFLFVFTLIIGTAYVYTGVRIANGLMLSGLSLYGFWILIAILILMIPISYFFSHFSHKELTQTIFSYFAFTGFGFFSILFSLVLFKDIADFAFGLLGVGAVDFFQFFASGFGFSNLQDANFIHVSITIATVGIAFLLTFYGFYQSHQKLKTIKVRIPIKNLHPDLIGFKIVQISDVHVGPTIKLKFLERVVHRINHLNPDVIVITGDLVDGPAHKYKQHIAPLKDLKSKMGSFYITGNHEYYSGVIAWIKEVERLGVSVLLNGNQVLKVKGATITIAGVTDLHAGSIMASHATDPFLAMKGGEASDYKILLAHQPNSIYQAREAGFDLQLSGHTHGGQYFPGNLFIYLAQRFVAGLHKYKNMMLYVSRGTGYWGPPLRIGAPSEITFLELVSA
jgi:predicted MPP superfamily phosphohydrolase